MPVFSGPFTSYYEDMDILNKLKEVDGSGSGLDADLLDAKESTDFVFATDYEDLDVLNKIKNVDGSGSGLDADTLDTYEASYFASVGHHQLASTVECATGGALPTTYYTVQDYLNIQGAGRISGGIISDNGDGTVAVSAGYGLMKTGSSYITGTVFLNWPTFSSVSLTDNALNYIYIDYNGGTPAIYATVNRSDTELSLDVVIGRVYRSGTVINAIQSGNEAFCITSRVHERLIYTDGGMVRASGGTISETGTRNITSTAGMFYIGLNQLTTTAKDTSGTDRFTYWYRNGSGGWTSVASSSQIDNLYWDDNTGTLNDLSGGRYGVHWVFIRFNGAIDVVYGQGDYTLALAEAASVPGSLPPVVACCAKLAAKILILKSATTLYSITSAYTTAFPVSSPSNHNDLGAIQGGTADQYYHLTATEYNTTVPRYWGELSSAPATYKPGDEYWDTSGAGVLKKYISYSVGWKSVTTL